MSDELPTTTGQWPLAASARTAARRPDGTPSPAPEPVPSATGPLAGQVAVVTGTAQGIGRRTADDLEAAGAVVHRLDRDDLDLADSAAVDAWFAALGRCDVLVNVAGGVVGQTHTPIEDLTDAAWDAVWAANVLTARNCTRAAARLMKPAGYGRIVIVSSGAGRSVSLTGIQAYTTSKAAQIGFTRQMAHELGPHGITVNCIAPGFVLSNPTTQAQWDSYGPDGQRALVERIAVRRTGTPEDIARGVAFFVAPDAGWVSGQTLSIDGGHQLF
ncbi:MULTISPECIES: SDR family NAD(P)-dependent oxidoreductase [unclassified Curtobacterium]|uniref:SDR family NAD(P)-dependent oxidoreductase n=1 Tax=unclassified Curtobacterium TaxID=257496 RepID=UPI000DA898AD|nr:MULTISPECIES: SDR family oxidoreductase [unclassified Curtobacterium]PZE24156.1 short-chain dehydrogenase [Curtobacterium sp. MCBD17_028]PZF60074.1 short-chain dehydrogenase [Curtobacterium sp. MCBD17_034]PZM34759.1 short-chain dehydrogenase [Curtobacterium sp. MCBD17_031]